MEQSFSVEIAGDITFPCAVENLGRHLLIFKYFSPANSSRLLYAGDNKVSRRRTLTKSGDSFVLSNVRKQDAGRYVCRVESSPVIEIAHQLDVKYPPKVVVLSPETQRVAQGSSVELKCQADGNPTPIITWSRTEGSLPSGELMEQGLSIVLEDVDRYVEGTYVCMASNGVGEADVGHMTIEVEYPPEINTEQAILHTGEGDEAKLVCVVHGRPVPRVTWTKNGQSVERDSHMTTKDGVHRHTLTISDVTPDDFGDYVCTAYNTIGTVNGTLRLTGLPKTPRMTSSPAGGEKESYTLTWEAESYSPIIQYRVRFRKVSANASNPDQHGAWREGLWTPSEMGEGMRRSEGPIHYMSHALNQLEAATDYEAVVIVENKYGWSNPTEVFPFFTRKEVAVGQSASGCGALAGSSMVAGIIILAAFLS
ncbi:protein amalgam-like isoform X2 [Oratosquilla oratoria]|uniref:protein amalgam-like isoform X2 n=1 Tax=Oratosquilla oratoria TaxID=337810 RepID=UPI003F75C87E